MKVTLTDKQIQAHDTVKNDLYKIIMYGGAIRGGKSFWLCVELFLLAIEYPGSKWLLLRESMPTIRRTILPTLMEVFALGFEEKVSMFNQQTMTITLKNGSQIIIMAESYNQDKSLNRFRGLSINGAGIDEINEINEETFDKVIERSGTNFNSDAPVKILCTCNPSHGWVKQRFYDKHIEGNLPEGWKYITAKITDNPYVPEDYYLSLKNNMPFVEYQRFVEGDWDVYKTENAFAYEYNPDSFETKSNLYNPNLPVYVSMDFNLNPFGVIFCHIFKKEGKDVVHVFDEASIENGNIFKMQELIKSRYGNKLTSMHITGDAMGRQRDIGQRDLANLYEQLRRGLGLVRTQIKVKSNPNHENSRADVNFFLKHIGELRINSENCKNLCKDMRVVQCNSMGKIIKSNRKDLAQRADHLDCFRYMVHNFMKDWIKYNRKTLNMNNLPVFK